MIRIQRQGNETNFYEWDTRYNMWKRKYTIIGDFDMNLAEVDELEFDPEVEHLLPCDDHNATGQRNVYCYNCNFDRKCPYEKGPLNNVKNR